MDGKPSRGRPRQYDPDVALAAALGAFRRHGYGATSLDDLSEATGMARPSLYAAFGNKFEIYRKAVRRFTEASADERRQALFDEPSLRTGLERYFDAIIAAYMASDGRPIGCAVLSVISGEAAADPDIAAELAAALARTDEQFRRRMREAKETGAIAAGADSDGLAAMLAALQHSLALRARAGQSADDLRRIARASIALILTAAGADAGAGAGAGDPP